MPDHTEIESNSRIITISRIDAMSEPGKETGTLNDPIEAERGSLPLLQMRPDRRLGHEWDDWDGQPLPGEGVFKVGPLLYFGLMAGAALLSGLLALAAVWLTEPRLNALHPALPEGFAGAILSALLISFLWLLLLAASLLIDKPLLPARLAERGPLPASMRLAEKLGQLAGLSRDRVGSSALWVFNRVALQRASPNAPDGLLLLLPRCLSRDSMRSAIALSTRHGVPAFVASRGRYARQMIRERRPSAVVAVACERDLVSGIADVGRRLPVLGSTLRMPMGPCRDTEFDSAALEDQLLAMLKGRGRGEDFSEPARTSDGGEARV